MIRRAALGVWGFVVGDDWLTAVGIVGTLCATALIASLHLPAWWLSPIGAVAILYLSVRRGLPKRFRA